MSAPRSWTWKSADRLLSSVQDIARLGNRWKQYSTTALLVPTCNGHSHSSLNQHVHDCASSMMMWLKLANCSGFARNQVRT